MRCVVIPDGGAASVQNAYAQVLAVHAALLHTGQILFFSGDEHDPGRHHLHQFDHARLMDCQTLAISSPAPSPTIRDLFCCGHAFLADGRLLVGGGTEAWTLDQVGGADPHGHAGAGHFRGTAEAYAYDPASNQWVAVHRMVPEPGKSTGGGRWYPTLVTLGNGHVAAFSGHPSDADTRHYNNTVEAFRPSPVPTGQWTDLGTVPAPMAGYGDLTYYPRAHLIKDGRLFFSSPINGQSFKWNTTTHLWTPVCAGPGNDYDGIGTNSVLLPLLPEESYRTRALVCGRSVAKRIDLDDLFPQWQPTLPRTLLANGTPPVRTHCNSVLLPTGDVVVCGGMQDPGNDPGSAVLAIEIYRPTTNSWATMPTAANAHVPRNYHSVALLMPDGRVWMAGSNKHASWSYHEPGNYPASLPTTAQDGSIDNRELRIELFEPWYVGRPDRPSFTKSASAVSVGATFEIQTSVANTISRVAAIRAGSSTHAFNPDQRYVGLPFTRGVGKLTVSVPDNENLLPPGHYLLFVLDSVVDPATGAILDVPSVGQFLRIDNAKPFKELKWEIKDTVKWEIKENLKREIDVFVKRDFEIPDPKGPREGDPFDKLKFATDPPEWLGLLAERVDNLERRIPQGRAFIKSEERPPVEPARPFVDPATQRTPPPTPDELALRDHHMPEVGGKGAHRGEHGGDGPAAGVPSKDRRPSRPRRS
jgi:hypothetical protein